VKGVITEIEGTTQINLHVKPAWIIIAFWLFWTFVLSIFLFQLDYKNIDFSIETIGHIFLFGVVPYLLGKLKVNWDKRRLLKWLKRRVLTVPNNGYSK
jgi:membrane associated rhomboid family serine protease